MTYNKIYAVIGEERHITLDPINYQYDVKQILVIQGETVPDYYEADVCNTGDTATLTMVGTAADGVEIPDKFLQDGRNVLVYVVIPGSGGDVQTRYDITIPVDERAEREDIDPSEAEQQQIDSLINALNSGVGRAEAAATTAAESATDAEGSAGEAEDKAENAEAWAVGQRAGTDVGTEDPTYHNNAKYYAGMAEAAAEEAGQHEASWETWVQRAESAADDAEGSARAAARAKADAEAAAQTATQKAIAAGESATAAAGSASEARQTVDGGVGAINTARDNALSAIGTARTNAVGNVNQAGAAQVTAVNQAGATQVQAVEDKGDEVLDSIPQDYSDLVDDVADLTRQISDETTGLDTKAPVILETVSGAIASFDDGADGMPIKSLVAQIEPVQDLHGYANPWPAGGGVNKFIGSGFDQTKYGISYVFNSDGSVTTAGTVTTPTWNYADFYTTLDALGLSVGDTISISVFGNDVNFGVQFYDDNTMIGGASANDSSRTSTIPEGTTRLRMLIYCKISAAPTAGEVINKTIYPQLEKASTPSPQWHPYSNICPITGRTGAEIGQRGKNLIDDSHPISMTNITLSDHVFTEITADRKTSIETVLQAFNNRTYVKRLDVQSSISPITFVKDDTYNELAFGHSGSTIDSKLILDVSALPNGTYKFWYTIVSNTHPFQFGYLMVKQEDDTNATFEPYTGNKISVTFPSEAGDSGTVYGGTVTLNPDRTGTMVVDRACLTLTGQEDGWAFYNGSIYNSRVCVGILAPKLWQRRFYGICSHIAQGSGGIVGDGDKFLSENNNGGIQIYSIVSTWGATENTLQGGKDMLAAYYSAGTPFQLAYELATPITYALTAEQVSGMLSTLYGQNNIWADTGDVTVTAPRDTKLYIDNKITQAIANALNS